MKLTPLDIHHKEFRRSIRGYNEEEVDVFLDQVAEEFERIFKENIDHKEQVEGMRDKVKQYEGVEQTLQKALFTAQQAADGLEASAKQESELIIKDAEVKAKEMIQSIVDEKEALQAELMILKTAEKEFREKFKSLIGEFQDLAGKRQINVANMPKTAPEPKKEQPKLEQQRTEPSRTGTEPPRTGTEPPRTGTEPPRTGTEPPRTEQQKPEPPKGQGVVAENKKPEQVKAEQHKQAEAKATTPQTQKVPTVKPSGAESETGFSLNPPDVGASKAPSVSGKEAEGAANLEAAQPQKAETKPKESEFKVTLGSPGEVQPKQEEVKKKPVEKSGQSGTDDFFAAMGDENIPEFAPKKGAKLGEMPGSDVVSSFFDDDLGVDEDEKKEQKPQSPSGDQAPESKADDKTGDA